MNGRMRLMALIPNSLPPAAPPPMIFTSGVVDTSYVYGKRPAIYEGGFLANPLAVSLQPGDSPSAETVPVRERDG